jgi:hypothetical protein
MHPHPSLNVDAFNIQYKKIKKRIARIKKEYTSALVSSVN